MTKSGCPAHIEGVETPATHGQRHRQPVVSSEVLCGCIRFRPPRPSCICRCFVEAKAHCLPRRSGTRSKPAASSTSPDGCQHRLAQGSRYSRSSPTSFRRCPPSAGRPATGLEHAVTIRRRLWPEPGHIPGQLWPADGRHRREFRGADERVKSGPSSRATALT